MESPGARPADFSPENPVSDRDRRRATRHRVNTPAYADLNGSSQDAVLELSEILNLGQGGMCIQASSTMKVNRLLPLCLDLSETNARIHTTGHVVWSEPSGRTGIRFPDMPDSSRMQLEQWLAANNKLSGGNQEQTSSLDSAVVSRPVQARPAVASGYTSLANEWSEIQKELEWCGQDVEAALQLIAQRAVTVTWASGAAIALINKLDPSEMICRARAGSDSPELGASLQAGSGFSGECVHQATTLKCDDSETDSRVDRESCRALGIRSIVACPVKRKAEVVGILEVFSPEVAAFWDNDLTILDRLAGMIAGIVARAEPNKTDVLAFRRHEVEETPKPEEPSLLANTLRSFENQERVARTSSPVRRVFLLVTGTLALAGVMWLAGPRVASSNSSRPADGMSRSLSQSAEAASRQNTYFSSNMRELKNSAVQGDAPAQYALGMRYATGQGVKQDYVQAMAWFRQAAEQNDVRAQAKMAAWYSAGRGAARDYSKAYFWGLLAQAGGEELGRTVVVTSAPYLSHAQIVAEQDQADKWLHSHNIGQSLPESNH
jgi:putative methionine-R-sulfoxide reductase with GAF domain/Tfp pilus assembly protein PilZ